MSRRHIDPLRRVLETICRLCESRLAGGQTLQQAANTATVWWSSLRDDKDLPEEWWGHSISGLFRSKEVQRYKHEFRVHAYKDYHPHRFAVERVTRTKPKLQTEHRDRYHRTIEIGAALPDVDPQSEDYASTK